MDLRLSSPGLRLTYTFEFLREIRIHGPRVLFTWNLVLARNENPLLIQLKKSKHSLRTVKRKLAPFIFSTERHFVLGRHNCKANSLHFFPCPQSLFRRLSTCNNTEIFPVCNLPEECLPRALAPAPRTP